MGGIVGTQPWPGLYSEVKQKLLITLKNRIDLVFQLYRGLPIADYNRPILIVFDLLTSVSVAYS